MLCAVVAGVDAVRRDSCVISIVISSTLKSSQLTMGQAWTAQHTAESDVGRSIMRRHHLWLLTAPLHIDPPSDESLTQSQTPGGLECGELFDKTITLAKAVGSLVGPYAGPMAGLAATLEVLRDFHKGVAGLRGEIYRVVGASILRIAVRSELTSRSSLSN